MEVIKRGTTLTRCRMMDMNGYNDTGAEIRSNMCLQVAHGASRDDVPKHIWGGSEF